MDTREVMSKFPSKWPLDRKRKAQDKLDSQFDWIECPPVKQMVIDNTVKDSYIGNSDGIKVTVGKPDEAVDNTYYEFEENCADMKDLSSVDHDNNNGDYYYEGEQANNINKKKKRDDDQMRSMVLSEEVRETISNRPKDGLVRIIPQLIMDRMYHQNTNTALVLWKPPSERSAMFKTLETIPPMSTVEEDDETNIITESLEKKVTLHDPGEMEL